MEFIVSTLQRSTFSCIFNFFSTLSYGELSMKNLIALYDCFFFFKINIIFFLSIIKLNSPLYCYRLSIHFSATEEVLNLWRVIFGLDTFSKIKTYILKCRNTYNIILKYNTILSL